MLIRQTLFIMVFFVFGSSYALAGTSPAGPTVNIGKPSADLEYHLEATSEYEQEALALKKRVQKLLQRLKMYNQKPYLDSKELRRNGIKRTLGTLMKEHTELQEIIAWHQEEAKLIQQADNSTDNTSSQSKVISDNKR